MILRAIVAGLGSLLVTLLILPATAEAAGPRVEPSNGSHVAALPKHIAIHTGLELRTVYVMVQTPDGSIEELKPTIGRRQVTAPLPPDGPRGEYEVAYRLVADDGEVTPGTIRFTVDGGRSPQATTGPTTEPPGSQDIPIIGLTLGAGVLLAVAALLVRRRVAAR